MLESPPSFFEFAIVSAAADEVVLQIYAASVLCNLSCHRRIVCICIIEGAKLVTA